MAVERHGIVVAHLTIFLDAKNFVEINLGDRHKRRTVLLRAHREQDIVTWDINLADEPVGRVHRRDPGQRQFLHQPVLQGLKHPLGPPAGLRRIRCDMLHAEMRQRPPNLGGLLAIHRRAGLGVVK